jgi:hypothetical protein
MSASRFVRSRVGRGLLAIAALALAGCGGRGDAAGKVTYQGKPVVWGTVQFEDAEGMVKQANIAPDGTYSVAGVAVGDAKVAVSSINPASSDFQPRAAEGRPAPPPPPPAVRGWFPIPDRYAAPHTSGLVLPIKAGANALDIELK